MTVNDLLPFRKATGIGHCGELCENASSTLNLPQNANTQTFLEWGKNTSYYSTVQIQGALPFHTQFQIHHAAGEIGGKE